MKSYLSLIPISAKVHRRQNRMTLLCIIFAVFLVTAIFSMAEMGARMEQMRLAEKARWLFPPKPYGQLPGADPPSDGGSPFPAGSDRRRADDFQQFKQQRGAEDAVLRDDALSRYEQTADRPLCTAGSPELV